MPWPPCQGSRSDRVRLGLDTTDSAETIEQRGGRASATLTWPEAGMPGVALLEKRKVDSSILSLTTSFGLVSSEAPPQTIEVGCSADVIVRVGSSSQP